MESTQPQCQSCWRKPNYEPPIRCSSLNIEGVCSDCAEAIAQGRDITRMTYAKHRSREREHRERRWAARSPEEKREAIAWRYEWLSNQMRTNPAFSKEVTECRFCGTEPALPGLAYGVSLCLRRGLRRGFLVS
jgi:hypothetical protein